MHHIACFINQDLEQDALISCLTNPHTLAGLVVRNWNTVASEPLTLVFCTGPSLTLVMSIKYMIAKVSEIPLLQSKCVIYSLTVMSSLPLLQPPHPFLGGDAR